MPTMTLKSPAELLHYQLRTALTMEDHSLAALGELAKAAKSNEIAKMFKHHATETREQIANLHEVFRILDLRDTTPKSDTNDSSSELS